MQRILQLTALLSFLILSPGTSISSSLHVPSEYPTIQAGINAAAIGDTVLLDSGLYYGEGNRDLDFLGKDITVRSHDDNPATCIITCLGSEQDPHQGFIFQSGETPQARLEGITISDAWYVYHAGGGAITCREGSSPTIKNCRLVNCFSEYGAGGLYSSSSSPTLVNCWIDNNSSFSDSGGILATGTGIFTMIECLVTGNDSIGPEIGGLILICDTSYLFECTIANNQGIGIYSREPLSIYNCTIVGNDTGIYDHSGDGTILIDHTLIAYNTTAFYENSDLVELSCCNVFGNANGDWSGPVIDQQGINGNISADPLLCDPDNWDFRVAPNSPCLGELCGQIGAWGVGECDENLSPVDDSPPLAFQLHGNFPNPFNPSTTIRYELNQELPVSLKVFDVTGKFVTTLIDGEIRGEGTHEATWNGRDKEGQSVAAGIFLYVLTTPVGRDIGKMALIK